MKEVYTSAEARRALRVDAKTFLRWLAQADMHPAVSKKDHRVKVFTAEQIERLASDHERVLTGNVASESTLSTEDRLTQLEARMSDVEAILKDMSHKSSIKRLTAPRASYAHKPASESSTLPAEYVPLADFYHGIPESTVRHALTSGSLAIQRGNWKKNGHLVYLALDAKGQAAFYAMYRNNPRFTPCDECPHSE